MRSSCRATYVGVDVDASVFEIAVTAPSVANWEQDRAYQCLLGVAGRRVVGDAEGTNR